MVRVRAITGAHVVEAVVRVDAEGQVVAVVDGGRPRVLADDVDLADLLLRLVPERPAAGAEVIADAALLRAVVGQAADGAEHVATALLRAAGVPGAHAAVVAAALVAGLSVVELEVVSVLAGQAQALELTWLDAGDLGVWEVPAGHDEGEVRIGPLDRAAVRVALREVLAR